jgi:hypothetical protein
MPNSHIINEHQPYVYGQAIKYECATGHTLNGAVGGPATFEVPCRADGTFPDNQESCVPTSCSVPSKTGATHDAGSGKVQYGKVITYGCLTGHELGGNGSTSFPGTCEADGSVSFAFALEDCVPVSCGLVEPVTNAALLYYSYSSSSYVPMPTGWEGKYGGATVRVLCEDGMTLGGVAGGSTFYTMSCMADKLYSATASGTCATIKYAVGGVVTDAQSSSIRLSGAKVKVTSLDKVTVLATATAGSSGIYWVDLPVGKWTFTVSYEGYITTNRNITILGYTSTGGVADMSLSQVLGEGEWRAVVEWDLKSRDIDSHIYWNNNAAHVYWAKRSVNDHATNIQVVLDRDDTNGVGPETTSFSGIGDCTHYSKCLVKFEIDNYTPYDHDLGLSNVHVKLYRGSSLDSEFEIPECAGATARGEH